MSVDVAYASPDVVAAQDDDTTTLIAGIPTLIAEILSPNVTQEQLKEKLAIYKKAGVPVVWVIDPEDRTVTVYRPGREPELFNVTHQFPAGPQMPGFAPAVLELLE